MIVGMHWVLGAQFAAQQLNGAIADNLDSVENAQAQGLTTNERDKGNFCTHLVDVHVTLSAGACLPDDQREVIIVEFARDDIIGGLRDGLTNFRIEPKLLVHLGSGLLQDAHGLHNGFLYEKQYELLKL